MGSCREILTIQLGNYANHVGAHFWNLQEASFNYDSSVKSEICHDALYREGISQQGGVTFTPRMICTEQKKGQAPIPLLDESVDVANISIGDQYEHFESPNVGKHEFINDLDAGVDITKKDYDFENTLRDWGDMLRGRLHPRSIVAQNESNKDEMEDRIRIFIEECDNLQGFHILLDSNESHSSVLTYLDDEYSSKSRITFPTVAGTKELTRDESATRLVRTFLNFNDSAHLSSLAVPLGCSQILSLKPELATTFQDLVYDFQSNYHTSAILATFLDTFSVSYRKQNKECDMFDHISGLTTRNWKFSGASLSFPLPISPGMTLQQALETRDDNIPLWSSLTPGTNTEGSWYQTFGLRGVSDGSILLQYLQFISSSVSSVCAVTHPITSLQPFPKIFSEHVSMRGSVDSTASRMPGFEVMSSPALAGLHSSPGIGSMLNNFTSLIKKINIKKLTQLEIETDIFEENIEAMFAFAKSLSFDDELN